MINKKSVLLINPPFGSIHGPFMTIPILVSYLKSQGINAYGFDLNMEFYKYFLTQERIKKSIEYIKKKFVALNKKDKLIFSEMYEYLLLYENIIDINYYKKNIFKIIKFKSNYKAIQSSKIQELILTIASLQYFPEIILTKPGFTIYSKFSFFSSSDILKNLEYENEYSKIYEDIILNFIKKYKNNLPRIIGFSAILENQILPAFKLANIIKKHYPEIHITFGGASITNHFMELKEKKFFDFVDSFIVDEGEVPLIKLVKELNNNKPDFSKVPNMIYLSNNNIIRNQSAVPVKLDELPYPDFNIFPLKEYPVNKKNITIFFRLSKGCSWKRCTFCNTELSYIKNYDIPSFELKYLEFKKVIIKTKVKNFYFSDDNTNIDLLVYISRRLIKEKIKIKWGFQTRIDSKIIREKCELFKKAGCIFIEFGVESLNNRILKLMKKGINRELIYNVLNEIKGVIPVFIYLVLGFPTETKDEALNNHNLVLELLNNGLISFYRYYLFNLTYGSYIYHNLDEFGIRKIMIPKEYDLSPTIPVFKSTGMDRVDAYKLLIKFPKNRQIHYPDFFKNEIEKLNSKLNFDLSKIRKIIHTEYEALYIPYIKWFEECDNKKIMIKKI